jgi:HK97 family phage major capsid protein
MARASLLDSPAPAAVSSSTPPAQPEGTLTELLSLLAASWGGSSGGIAKHAPEVYDIARAMTGFAGGQSGSFLIKPEWANEVFDKVRSYQGPFGRCRLGRTRTKEVFLPAYWETSRADGLRYGGVFGQWRGGGAAETETLESIASQPAMALIGFEMKRLMVYTSPISRDLAADALLLDTMLDVAVFNEMRFELEWAMFLGNGANSPLGVIGSPATIVVAKDSGQTAGTITTTNIDSMWKSLYGPCRRNATWHANDDCLAAIDEVATTAGWPQATYLPQGVGGNPYPLIKGRPLLPAEQLPNIGTPGDLVLADWSQYSFILHIMKGGAPELEVAVGLPGDAIESTKSEHLLFDTDSVAYKWKLRGDGKLMWPKPITTKNGLTVGPCCVIAQR